MSKSQRAELQKRNIGFVFQSYHLLDDMTVYENLELPLSYRNLKRQDRRKHRLRHAGSLPHGGKKDLYPNQLSGGQQQLVGVARALIANPKLILADEPTGNLHSSQAKEIMETFKRLNEEGVTIIQVTHSEKNAEYGDRIIEIVDGWIENPVAREAATAGIREDVSLCARRHDRSRVAAGERSQTAISNGMGLSRAGHSLRFAGSMGTCALSLHLG